MRQRLTQAQRHERALLKMAPGTLGGRVQSAAPIVGGRFRNRSVPSQAGEVALFSHDGTPTTDPSGPWVPRRGHSLLDVLIARATGTSAMTVTIYKNGASIGTVTTSAAGLVATGTITESFTAETDVLTVAVTTVGTATTQVTVEVTLL